MKTQERGYIQDNNGTKMATASAVGRPPASRPPDHPEGRRRRGRCLRLPHSNGMTTGVTHWNRRADASHRDRRASTVSSPSASASRDPPPLKPSNPQRPRRLVSVAPSRAFITSCHSFSDNTFLPVFFLFSQLLSSWSFGHLI